MTLNSKYCWSHWNPDKTIKPKRKRGRPTFVQTFSKLMIFTPKQPQSLCLFAFMSVSLFVRVLSVSRQMLSVWRSVCLCLAVCRLVVCPCLFLSPPLSDRQLHPLPLLPLPPPSLYLQSRYGCGNKWNSWAWLIPHKPHHFLFTVRRCWQRNTATKLKCIVMGLTGNRKGKRRTEDRRAERIDGRGEGGAVREQSIDRQSEWTSEGAWDR